MFKIRICSDLDYEEMVADVCWNNNTVATINQDQGIDKFEVELFPSVDHTSWVFPLDEMIEILNKAKKKLKEMRRLPD